MTFMPYPLPWLQLKPRLHDKTNLGSWDSRVQHKEPRAGVRPSEFEYLNSPPWLAVWPFWIYQDSPGKQNQLHIFFPHNYGGWEVQTQQSQSFKFQSQSKSESGRRLMSHLKDRQRKRILPYQSFILSGSQQIGWSPPTLGRAICRYTQNNV